MSSNQQLIARILEASRKMHAHGNSGQWDQLLEVDRQRAELVSHLSPDGSHGDEYADQIDQIRELQSEVMQLVCEAKKRVGQDYLAARQKLSVSSRYLENMESTLT